MSRKQKFGIKEKAEISDLCIPRNYIQVSILLLAVHIAQFLLALIGVNVLAVVSFAEDHRWNERRKHRTNELYGAEF